MRADRLVAILMLLQRRGRVAARELAETLEVSVRTIYRDLDALSAAGIPVYAERGAQGGLCLDEHYRTELTGLTEGEAQALFLLSAPGPLDALDVGQKLRAALRKLQAALPDYRGGGTQPSIHLDWSGWGQRLSGESFLETLYRGVMRRQAARVVYRLPVGEAIRLTVQPLGLVAKAGAWHLVYRSNGKIRSRRVSGLLQAELLEETFEPPEGFDLRAYWEGVCAAAEAEARAFRVEAWVTEGTLAELRRQFGERLRAEPEGRGEGGRMRVELAFESFDAARQRLLGLGRGVEVIEPEALRLCLLDYARQIVGVYEKEEM